MSDYKFGFEMHPETLIETREILAKSEDAYESYLAMEMERALEESDVEWRDWVQDPSVEWGHREESADDETEDVRTMTRYKYGTILEAQDDGRPPNDNIEEGDLIIKAGKHEKDSLEYIASDGDLLSIEFESVAVYENDRRMSQREAHEFAKEQWIDEHDE